jgi:hypothetical protein
MKELDLSRATEEEIRAFELKKEVLQRMTGKSRKFDYICTDCEMILRNKEQAMDHLIKTKHSIHETSFFNKEKGES